VATSQAEEKEQADVVNTLMKSIVIVEEAIYEGGAVLLQLNGAAHSVQAISALVEASMLSTAEAGRIASLAQTGADSDDSDAPAADGHDGGKTMHAMTHLLEEAEKQLEAARAKEAQDLHEFQAMGQNLKDDIKVEKKGLQEAQMDDAAASEAKAKAKGDHEMTAKELAADTTALRKLHHGCMSGAPNLRRRRKAVEKSWPHSLRPGRPFRRTVVRSSRFPLCRPVPAAYREQTLASSRLPGWSATGPGSSTLRPWHSFLPASELE